MIVAKVEMSRRLLLCIVAIGLFASGCNTASSPQAASSSPEQLLARMVEVYHAAQSYADSGQVRLSYDGRNHVEQTYDFSVTFERPNKLRMHCYHASIVCDGKKLRATIDEVPNQVLSLNAPAELTTTAIYENEALRSALTEAPAGGSVQLALLLDEKPLLPVLAGAQSTTLLPAKTIDDRPCIGVQVRRDDGLLTFWIDEASYIVRRIEYPIDELHKFLSRDENISNLAVVVDLKGARIDQPVAPVAFQFEMPAGAKAVAEFQSIPRPEPPSPLLGKQIPEFRFNIAAVKPGDRKPVTRDALSGKIVVLDFWATWCGPCFQSLPNLEQVYHRYKDNSRVAFLAVSIDRLPPPGPKASAVSTGGKDEDGSDDQALLTAFREAKLSVPIVRDTEQFARVSFGVQQIPTMFILGPDGTVQDYEVGYNPELARELPERLDKLLSGQSIFADAQARYEARLREYEAQFRPEDGGSNLPRAAIAPRSEPITLRLTKLWSSTAVKQPGNILVVEHEPDSPQILVNDGWKSVAVLNAKGELLKTHELTLPSEPEEGIVSFLRTAVDSDGKRYFVGVASTRQQLHVFDPAFKRLFSYPEGTSVGGIADVQLGDLDGDGHPEINIGYYDVVGVQNVALDGKRRWANRALANVYRMAVGSPDAAKHRLLLCANQRGSIVPIDDTGRDRPPIAVGTRLLRAVFAADLNGDGVSEYCGLAFTRPGDESLVGFSGTGSELWNYPLPFGLQNHPPLEMVTHGNLVGKTGQWVCAGADGSVHIIAGDGTLIDRFQHGTALAGLAVGRFESPVLLVATATTVEAWAVSDR